MPRTGRPPKGNMSKNISLQLRISQETSDRLQTCAKKMRISRTEVIEQGIDMVFEKVREKK